MTYITNYLLSIPLEMCHPIYLVLGQLARQQWSLIFILFGCNRMLTRTVEHGADATTLHLHLSASGCRSICTASKDMMSHLPIYHLL
jgi:hypothetical protein